ncbi:hypothetical protein CO610_02140 [Lysobacteraceae bacterium NML95-0200]|nr:hypothetical protein CO610_02140 [Xanthomonadaceae bacterium NML95-0200]
MGSLFDVYRQGYQLGVADAQAGRRRRARWELWLLRPLNWLPGVDANSFVAGYIEGYSEGLRLRLWQQHLIPPLH